MNNAEHRFTSMRFKFNSFASGIMAFTLAVVLIPATRLAREPKQPAPDTARVTKSIDVEDLFKSPPVQKITKSWHPPHRVKSWRTSYMGKAFRVTQLPRCEHIETLITYDPAGETLKKAKIRTGGVAVCSGSFHNSRSMALADFLQKDGSVISSSRTGRGFLAIQEDGKVDISRDYALYKHKSGISALALGQRLIPLEKDGFSTGFMNRQTARMAIGINDNFIFIVQGKSDIWKLAGFMKRRLPVTVAINSDGGHVVPGKAPVHIVFRWKKPEPDKDWVAQTRGNKTSGGNEGRY